MNRAKILKDIKEGSNSLTDRELDIISEIVRSLNKDNENYVERHCPHG